MPTILRKERLHGGSPREGRLVDFSVDVNPLGFPESVRATVTAHLEAIQHYPDPHARALREAIATSRRLSAESILPGNGSAELIALIVQGLRPATALVIAPTFTEYEWVLEQAGVPIRYTIAQEADTFRWADSLDGWVPPLDDIDIVFLCNPNNPTGVAVSRDRVLELAARCQEHHTTLIVDEAFIEWTDAPEQTSAISAVSDHEGLIVLRSLTKLFAVPGLRIGYLAATPALVERFRRHQSAWPLNTFALAVGEQLMKETAYVTRSRQLVRDAVQKLFDALRGLPGLRPFPSSTNFILCRLTAPNLTSTELCTQLTQRGMAVRNCDDFTGLEPGRFIRIGTRTPADNACLITALRDVLATKTEGTQTNV